MKLYMPNAEERAFLFQEAQALEGLMKEIGSLRVVVETAEPKTRYRVTFVVAPESVGMRVQATAQDLYQAAIAAKEETERQLNAIVNEAGGTTEPQKIPFEFLH